MTDYCKTCEHDEDIGFCDKCFYNHILEERGIPPTMYEAKPKPLTNYDRIRAMSVEEMAEFLRVVGGCGPYHDQTYCKSRPRCEDNCWLDWLKQEAEE